MRTIEGSRIDVFPGRRPQPNPGAVARGPTTTCQETAMSRWTRRLYAGVNVFFLMLMPALALSANAADKFYQQHHLVSDGFVPADNLDPHLINAWGIVFGPTNPVWVSDQGSGVATLYDGLGHSFPPPPQGPLVLNIPKAPNHGPATGPTGIVFNDSTGLWSKRAVRPVPPGSFSRPSTASSQDGRPTSISTMPSSRSPPPLGRLRALR